MIIGVPGRTQTIKNNIGIIVAIENAILYILIIISII